MRESMEQFRRLVASFAHLGDWRIRRIGAQHFDDVLVATLKGTRGKVEVWGGNHHRREVWCVGRDGSETFVAKNCHAPGDLRRAVLEACDLAGVQTRMEVGL